jgi:predicted PurR-regulated permease PerM
MIGLGKAIVYACVGVGGLMLGIVLLGMLIGIVDHWQQVSRAKKRKRRRLS